MSDAAPAESAVVATEATAKNGSAEAAPPAAKKAKMDAAAAADGDAVEDRFVDLHFETVD